jgi:Asp-tRNA(Asn)/Glu-tRNA(Gln) amidotransferase B subunit
VIDENPAEWERYRNGDATERKKLSGFFTGKVMKASKGQANGAKVVSELERLTK